MWVRTAGPYQKSKMNGRRRRDIRTNVCPNLQIKLPSINLLSSFSNLKIFLKNLKGQESEGDL